jgi:hypothetical protein
VVETGQYKRPIARVRVQARKLGTPFSVGAPLRGGVAFEFAPTPMILTPFHGLMQGNPLPE